MLYKFLTSISLFTVLASTALTQNHDGQVLYYLDHKASSVIVTDQGTSSGTQVGDVYKVYRQSPGSDGRHKIEVGSVKVVQVWTDKSIAEILSNGTPLSKSIYFPQDSIMAGDLIEKPRYLVQRKPQLLPEIVLLYDEIFINPKAQPDSYEISPEGEALIKERTNLYRDKRFSRLLIKGFTDIKGQSRLNQAESYERALTVRQYLIDQLAFDPDRTVALGLGETYQHDQTFGPGYQKRNRRIVLSLVYDDKTL